MFVPAEIIKLKIPASPRLCVSWPLCLVKASAQPKEGSIKKNPGFTSTFFFFFFFFVSGMSEGWVWRLSSKAMMEAKRTPRNFKSGKSLNVFKSPLCLYYI